MANKLFTSKNAETTINKIHSLLGLQNKYYVVARLAVSIGLLDLKGSMQLSADALGKEFNEYTLLNNENYYDTIIRNLIKNGVNRGDLSDDDIFGNQSVIKKALDYGCVILEKIYEDSNGISDLFLKKLFSLKDDKVLLKKLIHEEANDAYATTITTPLSKSYHQHSIIDKSINKEEDYINETVSLVREFMENMGYSISDSSYVLSNSVLRVKIKLPLGKSINSIGSKMDDLKLHLGINEDIIVGPISGYLCFDIPRKNRENVYLMDIVDRISYNSVVKFPLGTSTDNEVISLDLANSNTAHLLIAGATGQGKSECLKSIIGTLISKNFPEDLKLILIDPKKVEFSRFRNIPHLLLGEIITEVGEAILSLENAVIEMNKRYDLLSEYQVNSIDKYNQVSINKISKIIIIFDEFADFILSGKEQKERLEDAIKKLSGKARAAGIHLILSTQRPDKDIITGVIKANLPAKIAFKTGSPINSSIIIDTPDASKLFGKGDMLLNKEGALTRIQGAYISDEDLDKIILGASQ